jgi:hypothetical protein
MNVDLRSRATSKVRKKPFGGTAYIWEKRMLKKLRTQKCALLFSMRNQGLLDFDTGWI